MFTQKTTRHATEPNSVPEKCWEETSVDLFGPLPSSHHVLVVQDLASRYPVAKIVKSTNAKSVILVLRDTYYLFGNPLRQKSDNGPPFNSNETTKDTRLQTTLKLMKPLGKAMRIGNIQNLPEQETLSALIFLMYREQKKGRKY